MNTIRACERSGKRSGAGRKPTSGAVSGVQKIKWSVSGEAREGGRRDGNGAASGQNLPLKNQIRSTVKPLKDFKSYHETVSVN